MVKGALAYSVIHNIIRTIYETIIDFNFIEIKSLITVLYQFQITNLNKQQSKISNHNNDMT